MPYNRSYEIMKDSNVKIGAMEQADPSGPSTIPKNIVSTSSNSKTSDGIVATCSEHVRLNKFHRRNGVENFPMKDTSRKNTPAPYSGPAAYNSDTIKWKNGYFDHNHVLTAYEEDQWGDNGKAACWQRKQFRWTVLIVIAGLVGVALGLGIYYAVACSEEDNGHISDITISMQDYGMQWYPDLKNPLSESSQAMKLYYESQVSSVFEQHGYKAVVNVTCFKEHASSRFRRAVRHEQSLNILTVIFTVNFIGNKRPGSVVDIEAVLAENPDWRGITISAATSTMPSDHVTMQCNDPWSLDTPGQSDNQSSTVSTSDPSGYAQPQAASPAVVSSLPTYVSTIQSAEPSAVNTDQLGTPGSAQPMRDQSSPPDHTTQANADIPIEGPITTMSTQSVRPPVNLTPPIDLASDPGAVALDTSGASNSSSLTIPVWYSSASPNISLMVNTSSASNSQESTNFTSPGQQSSESTVPDGTGLSSTAHAGVDNGHSTFPTGGDDPGWLQWTAVGKGSTLSTLIKPNESDPAMNSRSERIKRDSYDLRLSRNRRRRRRRGRGRGRRRDRRGRRSRG